LPSTASAFEASRSVSAGDDCLASKASPAFNVVDPSPFHIPSHLSLYPAGASSMLLEPKAPVLPTDRTRDPGWRPA
jgi:hypothetical protein